MNCDCAMLPVTLLEMSMSWQSSYKTVPLPSVSYW